ncbi:hypothetical protein DFQ28_000968 [Apophysomyces sp. BC1034]|nr:hypothetical protein DFQ30_008750 [Apophysomyces sp. BC1015]KAG0183308.1 hypothetical protein DFQ29_006877 [Apophysomyces sp. BC1021]KAG0194249.1 hypothetical protein DFQ28_000968 [Apophysomyces sp. BC1034]
MIFRPILCKPLAEKTYYRTFVLKQSVFLVASLVALASARNITYSVITSAGDQQTVAVVVDRNSFQLKPSSDSRVLFTGEAPEATESYNYAKFNGGQMVEQEAFLRHAVKDNTPNEFYNRTWNTVEPVQLPTVMPPMASIDRIKSNLHLNNQIVTLHFEAGPDDFNKLHSNSTMNTDKVTTTLTYITLNGTQKFTDVEIKLAGNSARMFPKLTYNIKLAKKQSLAGFRTLKLRSLATDPSYIREKTVYDIIESVGVASTQFSVFFNNQAYGLFGLIETFKNPWVDNEFGGGRKDFERGILYQGQCWSNTTKRHADLQFRGDNQTLYNDDSYKIKVEPAKGQPMDYTRLMEFTKFLASAPTNGSEVVKEWEKHIDTESVVRNMALEILLGFADGYITNVNNFYIYDNRKRRQFTFIPSDTDFSMGSTMVKLDNMWNGNYHQFAGMSLSRPLVQKMLEVPELKQQFEQLLVKICKEVLNPQVMNPYIDNLANMVREDVAWDRTLPRANPDAFKIIEQMAASADAVQQLNDVAQPTFDMNTTIDLGTRLVLDDVTFDMAVNGPTGHISLSGVKEWVARQSEATLKYFSQ